MTSLRALEAAGVLSALDRQFAERMATVCEESRPEVILAAALASRAVRHGHVCAELAALSSLAFIDEHGESVELELPSRFEWGMQLGSSPMVRQADDPRQGGGDWRPLVLDKDLRLYLRRYWDYERHLARALVERAATPARLGVEAAGDVRATFERLFGEDGGLEGSRQAFAAALALVRSLLVVCGGPGTGKTTTVVRILALLQACATQDGGRPLRIALLAPTGKAAARLRESVVAGVERLGLHEQIGDTLPDQASTIHRALGFLPRTPTRFAHDADNPLEADVVVVDEASMIDLALFSKLVDAVPPHARLILLGDRDQLASVEAGAILGDICDVGEGAPGSASVSAELEDVLAGTPVAANAPAVSVAQCVVPLTHSHRFAAGGAVGTVASAINAGDAEALRGAFEAHDGARLIEVSAAAELPAALAEVLEAGYAGYFEAEGAEARLTALHQFRVLCAHRRGPAGVESVVEIAERRFRERGWIGVDPFYDGRPVMITRNDHDLQLYNGDIGVVERGEEGPTVVFAAGGGRLRRLDPARLPQHETPWAMTVHKSQGSEFDRVALVTPVVVSPTLTRELLYTAVTRARSSVAVLGTHDVLAAAVERRIQRASGLRAVLRAGGAER